MKINKKGNFFGALFTQLFFKEKDGEKSMKWP